MSAKSRQRFSKRFAILGVPLALRASSKEASSTISIPSNDAARKMIVFRSSSS